MPASHPLPPIPAEKLDSLAARLTTHSLRQAPWGASVRRVLAAALGAVDPAAAVRAHMQRKGNSLRVGASRYDLERCERVLLVGAGKAGAPMAAAAAGILGERLSAGLVIVKDGYADLPGGALPAGVQIVEAGHPLPDERGLQAAARMSALLERAGADDLVICLISGGGSALLAAPAPGLGLDDLQALTEVLLACGAEIGEINSLRKHLETLKGGGLARLAAPATLVALVLSDVIGDPLDVIASGPTVPDQATFQDAYRALERHAVLEQVPAAILRRLRAGMRAEIPETPKPGDPLFERVFNLVIGGNRQAARAALAQAEREGFNTLLLTTYLQGEARQAGRALGAIARQVAASGEPLRRPACLVAGGETTVTLSGGGLGGRNQEVALGAVRDLDGLPEVALVTLATDGGDGPSDAAGAVVTGETLRRARELGLSPEAYLRRNDAYHFFEPLGDLLRPGATQTNVNDLNFIFAF